MTQTNDTPPITTDFRDIFGKQGFIELQLNQHMQVDEDGVLIPTLYIQAKTPHQAKLALANSLVTSATRMNAKRIGELAVLEMARLQDTEE